ncbi:MAG: hypothetical protein R3C68_09940 [Myxococcota bacterium]
MDTDHPDFPYPGAFGWRALGYHFPLASTLDIYGLGGVASSDPWIALLAILEEAKTGNFTNVDRVVDCILTARDWVLLRAAVEVLGNTASANCLRAAVEQLRNLIFVENDTTIQIEFSHSLWCSHFLWTVPIISEIYLNMDYRRDAYILPISLAGLLGDNPLPYPEEPVLRTKNTNPLSFINMRSLKTSLGVMRFLF